MELVNAYKRFWNNKKYFTSAFFLLFAVGLLGSLKITFTLWGLEPDIIHSAMLWDGIRNHGLPFIKEWLFTTDNWLFSLVPMHFFLFWIFGDEPIILILSGWLIFVASVLLSGMIARNLHAPKSAIIIPVVLIFSGFYAHEYGFITYANSHNLTNLYGLFSIFCLTQWMKTHRLILLLLIVLSVVTGGLSDPWMTGAYVLPITVASLILCFIFGNSAERKQYIFLFLAMTASLVVIETRLFGVLSFLPTFHFQIASWDLLKSNAIYLIKDLGGLFNLVPGNRSNGLIPGLASLLIVFLLVLRIVFLVLNNSLLQCPRELLFYSIIILSSGGISLACLISSSPAANLSARFLINVLYLIIIGSGVALELNWNKAFPSTKLLSIIIGFIFVISGIVSNLHLFKSFQLNVNYNGIYKTIDFLKNHNLIYGYGPYWGSNANVITWLSKSTIKIRPVVFDKTSGQMIKATRFQSSKLWYLPENIPSDLQNYFVVVKSDGEECPDTNLCMDGLAKQFGAPAKILPYESAYILVWNHPLMESD